MMGRVRDLTEAKKAEILTYLKCGKTQSETARLCSVSQQSVSRVSRIFTTHDLSYRRKDTCITKTVLNNRAKRILAKEVKRTGE